MILYPISNAATEGSTDLHSLSIDSYLEFLIFRFATAKYSTPDCLPSLLCSSQGRGTAASSPTSLRMCSNSTLPDWLELRRHDSRAQKYGGLGGQEDVLKKVSDGWDGWKMRVEASIRRDPWRGEGLEATDSSRIQRQTLSTQQEEQVRKNLPQH